MAELINWVKSSPVKTPITQPIRLQIHAAFEPRSGITQSSGKEWSNQNVKVSEPGDPEEAGIFATIWGGLDLRGDIGKVIKISPGPKGGGIKIAEDYKDPNGRTLDIGQAAQIAVEGGSAAPAAPPMPTQVGGQASMPMPSQPGIPQPQQPSLPSMPSAPPQQSYGPGPLVQPQEVVGNAPPPQPAADPRDANLKKFRDMICGASNGFEIAMDAAVATWARINARHGLSPGPEDLRATAITLLIQAKEAMTDGGFGTGAKASCLIPHVIEGKVPDIPGQQLCAERAALEEMWNAYAQRQQAQGQQG